jgi:hypothetical protein
MKFDPDLVQSFFDSADAAMYLPKIEVLNGQYEIPGVELTK